MIGTLLALLFLRNLINVQRRRETISAGRENYMSGSIALDAIERVREKLEKLSIDIWNNPEGAYKEFKAAKWSADMLREYGFKVETGAAGIPTAIKAVWGSGHPVIGFLGEYDALPGLSQKVDTAEDPVTPGGYGHGCGHNLLGAAHIGAVIGMKEEMISSNLPGTIIYYGCPAEEVLTGKLFMVKGGAFDCLDLCIQFHPGMMNTVGIDSISCLSTKFHFKGIPAHPSIDPHNGRSALDAAELTNVGANYLREHVKKDVSFSYIITDGGSAPNIIPSKASVWYIVRAREKETVEEVHERLVKVAKGAAMMTETVFEEEFLGAAYGALSNKVLEKVVHEAFLQVPQEELTVEELDFAKALNDIDPEHSKAVREKYGFPHDEIVHTGLLPIQFNLGSTDVGDIQHMVPGVSFRTACYGIGVKAHTWPATACAGHSLGRKGMIRASKIMALFGMKLLTDPDIYVEAKKEFDNAMAGKNYSCSVPKVRPF